MPRAEKAVVLRAEHLGADWRNLWAYLDDGGSLHIEGQDLGPSTAIVSSDGEYKWGRVFRSENIPRLLALLDAPADANILEVLERDWTGEQAVELERRMRESDIPYEQWVWSG